MTQLPSKAPLSDSAIGSMPSPKSGRASIRDSRISQLSLLLGPRSRTWYLHATVHRRTHRVRLGPWPIVTTDEARDKCLAALRRIWRGEVIAPARPTVALSLDAVLSEYLTTRKLSHQASGDLRSVIAKHAAQWVSKPIDAIDARDVAKKYRVIAATKPAPANRLLAALSALTRYAHAAHGVGDASLITRVRALLGSTEQIEARKVVIPDAAMATWCAAVEAEAAPVARYLKALMLTGMRANELRKLPRSGWDAEAGSVRVATTKNGKPHELPAGPALCALLSAEAESLPADGALFDIPEKVYRAACARVGMAVGFDWHLHDLRRTFATVATRSGIDVATVKCLMNHTPSGDVTAKHYVQRTVEDLRPAMTTIEVRLVAMWTGTHSQS